MILNRFDVEDVWDHYHNRVTDQPNYRTATEVLTRLVGWTDANSDGWPYWAKPSRAATKLQEKLNGWRRRWVDFDDAGDLTDDELNEALRPIKAFLTRIVRDHDGGNERDQRMADDALVLRSYLAEVSR